MSKSKIGPTGDFPRGQLNEADEGGLGIGVGIMDKTLVISFGKPVRWIGMPKEQAYALAKMIRKAADKL